MRSSPIRRPAVAGTWYSGSKPSLVNELRQLFLGSLGPGKIPKVEEYDPSLVGLVSPHAGYAYSGQAAAWGYAEAAKHGPRELVIILGPNHRGSGSGISFPESEVWQTPIGEVEIDRDVEIEIAKQFKSIDFDEAAHSGEHSIELQLPFLQFIYGSDFKLVPISIWLYDLELAKQLGSAIARTISGSRSLVIASSDMTHYVPSKVASERDSLTLREMCNLNEDGTWNISQKYESLCGSAPVVSVIRTAKELGAKKGRVLKYYNSGDITGDNSAVVGYSSVALEIQ